MRHSKGVVFSFFILVSLSIPTTHCEAKRAVPDDLIVYPVLITLDNESKSKGSGFYFNDEQGAFYLITAFHVFFEKNQKQEITLRSNKALLLSYPKNLDWSKPAKYELDLESLKEDGHLRYSFNDDIAAVQIARTKIPGTAEVNEGVKRITDSITLTVPRKNVKLYDDVLIGNDVYISGYPSSLGIQEIPQIDYNRPLLRKGIVAGKNDSMRTITIDCPTYGGNSGGPVIELEMVQLGEFNVRVIGIIVQFVPFVEKWINPRHGLANIEFENSGYTVVVPMNKILKVIDQF